MNSLVWRIKFMFAVRNIFSRPKGAFKGNHLKLGWKVANEKYNEYKSLPPYEAALKEIGKWYDLD